ncbi:MAG: ribonuclease III [Betaproteobacteria bacterium]|nr:ribonuclease III [Betaproteobacteria bacterium]
MKPVGLESTIGHPFAQPEHLVQALTHRSFGSPHNERLEFLGDSVLNCRVASLLFERFATMPEGDLSRIRANLVNQATLARLANDLGLGDHLRLGEGELKSGGAFRASILADAYEAVLGAIFLDAGFEAAGRVIDRHFHPLINDPAGIIQGKDPKTQLQEWLQGRRQALPEYRVLRIEGAHHQQHFVVECRVASKNLASEGGGTSRRVAEQQAASAMLAKLAQGAGA